MLGSVNSLKRETGCLRGGRVPVSLSHGPLNSARVLVKHEETRKDQLEQYLTNNPPKKDQDCILEGTRRLNISSLPSICIDAKRASFRDDAIGVRPRASTGRKVVRDASK